MVRSASLTLAAIALIGHPSAAYAASGPADLLSVAAAPVEAGKVPQCSDVIKTNCKRKSGGKWILLVAGVAVAIGAVAAANGGSSSP